MTITLCCGPEFYKLSTYVIWPLSCQKAEISAEKMQKGAQKSVDLEESAVNFHQKKARNIKKSFYYEVPYTFGV
jgi:hypothetical protein